MKRKLLVLNLALLALVVWVSARIRQEHVASKARERAVLGKPLEAVPPAPVGKLPAAEPVIAAGYSDIAQKMLFAKDRNPNVVIEEAPPPPKPMPPLPVVHGLMEFPDGVMVMMALKSGAADRGYRVGDEIGEFKLMAVDAQSITFEWDGKPVTKRLEEVLERKAEPAPAAAAQAPAAAPSKRAPAAPTGQPAPGVSIGGGIKACQPGDKSPPGTVADGMRKVVTPSPFGEVCRWEPVQ